MVTERLLLRERVRAVEPDKAGSGDMRRRTNPETSALVRLALPTEEPSPGPGVSLQFFP